MKNLRIWNFPFLVLAVVLLIISGCTKDDPNLPPGKVTLTRPDNAASSISLDATLSWQAATDPDGGAITYDVYFDTDAAPTTIASPEQTGVNYTPTLSANTTYYWKVVANDPDGGTSQSDVWSFTTMNNAPGTVTLTTPSNAATDVALDATLSWQAATDPDGGAIIYDVYFGTDDAPTTIASPEQTGVSYAPTLSANTTYYWKVVAKDPDGGTSESAAWSFTTINNAPGTVTLTAPSNAATDVALDATLSWQAATDPDGGAITYDVYFGTDVAPSTIASPGQTGVSYTPTMSANTTYYWKVVAKDPDGGTSESDVWSFTTSVDVGENYIIVDNVKYPLNLGHHIWGNSDDCGSNDGSNIFAHGLYLTSNISMNEITPPPNISPLPSGQGNIIVFNLLNRDSVLISGNYNFINDVDCYGAVSVGDSTFTMSATDKFVTTKEKLDPTHYALDVDLDIDWDTVDFDNPSDEVINKYGNYVNARVEIIEGNVTVEKNDDLFIITIDCIDSNGLIITGRFSGPLNWILFDI